MPELPSYIPNRDADLVNWGNNFSTLLTASPSTYGLLASDATDVAASFSQYDGAYAAAVNPPTRTPVTVQDKNDARTSFLATVRPFAQVISQNAGVLTSDKIAIGVNPRTNGPSPIAAPTTNPILSLISAPPLQHILRYRDETSSPSVKSKPYGVLQVQLFAGVSTTVVTDPAELPWKQVATKSPALVTWSSDDRGKQAYYAARWMTRRGLLGPWSPIVSYTVAG